MLRNSVISALMILLLIAAPALDASELYQWTDEDGVTHFATSLDDVPEKYRDQIRVLGFDQEAQTTPSHDTETDGESTSESPTSGNAQPDEEQDSDLKRFEIPFQAFEGSARRVIISVTFNDRVTAQMALDTGAPGMVISFDLAERLGLFSEHSGTLVTQAGGIGGVQAAILTIVDSISVGDARAVFVPATVTEKLSTEFEGLIGMDFLTNYTISINSQDQVLVFQETPLKQDSRGGHDETWWRNTFSEFRSARDLWQERAEAYDSRSGSRSAEFVRFQAREAEKLLLRLDRFASDNGVPRHWR